MTDLSVGIVGMGAIGTDRHLPAFRNADGARVACVHDHRDSTTKAVAKREEVTPAYSFDEALELSDLVVLCTPPWAHSELAIEALNRETHVFSEKPMAMSTAAADEVLDAAAGSTATFSVVSNFRYMRSMQRARQLVSRGRLGEVVRTHAIQLRQFDTDAHSREWFRRLPGGMFWDESPHAVYLTREFLGELSVTAADGQPRDGAKQRQNIRARFGSETDATGHLVMDFDAPISEWWFVVMGTNGIVFVDLFRDIYVALDRERDHSAIRVLSVILESAATMAYRTVVSGLKLLLDRFVGGYAVPEAGLSTQASAVVDAVRAGERPPVAGQHGREDVETMESIAREAGFWEGNRAYDSSTTEL